MKIRPSLKRYLVIMMIMTGVTTITCMSFVSFNYFIMGIDFSMYDAMRVQAKNDQVSDGNPFIIDNIVIATRWRDLPEPIQENLNEQDLRPGELLKYIEGNPLYSRPKAGYFAIKIVRNDEVRFVSKMFLPDDKRPRVDRFAPLFRNMLWIALLAITLFCLVPYFVLRNIATPVERLMRWTKQLNGKDKLAQPIPDFHYRELNNLAKIVQSSQQSLQQSLLREKRFLGYASHELRTPIAVTRTNTELLRKMIDKGIAVEKQQQVVDRIERACFTMTDLTETLLWLNRQPDRSIPVQSLSIGGLSQLLLVDLDYLRQGKEIDISISTDGSHFQLPEALCRIIITNLIRNALQHTQQGTICITQSGTQFIISNQNINVGSDGQDPLLRDEELGFGLGLELTQRLVQHYGWQYNNSPNERGHDVQIDFSVESESTAK